MTTQTTAARPATDIEERGRLRGLRGLVIAEVEPVLLSYRYPADAALRWSGGSLPGVTVALVRIRTHDGLQGIGETYAGNHAPEVARALIEHFRPLLIGRDAADVAGTWNACYRATLYWGRFGIAISVLSAIEAALWDLCGKSAGLPVHRLLGGPVHDALPRYASGGMDGSTDTLRCEQARYGAAGFRATKIRAGVSPHTDAARARAAREAIGGDVGLAVDAVQGSNPNPWNADQAIAAGRQLEELDLLWLEEPCAATDIEGYIRCRRELDIPIAGGESCTTLHEFRRFLDAGALDIAQPDAAHVGGVLETLRVGAHAAWHGVDVAVHAWAGGGCLMANYHAGFAMPNCRWLEYPTLPNPLVDELLTEPLRVVDGLVLPPEAPGLGIELRPDTEERYPYRAGNHYFFEERR